MPKSRHWCSANMPSSTKLPGSSSASTRSRAVSLPARCCAASRSSPPAARACASRSSSRAISADQVRPMVASVAETGGRTLILVTFCLVHQPGKEGGDFRDEEDHHGEQDDRAQEREDATEDAVQ